MLKTIDTIESDKQQREVLVINAANTPGRTPKRMKKDEISQEDIMRDFAQDNGSGSDAEEDGDEIERYVKSKLVFSKDEPVLTWWKKWSINYPQLSLLARSLLGVPASSATSERIFSASGRILEERRQNLNENAVDDMLLLRNFRKCIE
jgi:hypothetical protein